MDKHQLKDWRHMVGLSQQKAADILGYGRRNYQMMERGTAEIRTSVALACAAYALGIRNYGRPDVVEVQPVAYRPKIRGDLNASK